MMQTHTKAASAGKAPAASRSTNGADQSKCTPSVASKGRGVKPAARVEVVWPAWPRPLAHVESSSTAGAWHVVDLDQGTCSCKGHTYRGSCRHVDMARADQARLTAQAQGAREKRALLALMAEYAEPVWFFEPEAVAS